MWGARVTTKPSFKLKPATPEIKEAVRKAMKSKPELPEWIKVSVPPDTSKIWP